MGHACSPALGSEPGGTWNWAWHLSSHHDVWVLAHPQHRAAVERFLAEHPRGRLRFVWVTPPPRWDPWDPGRGERGIRLHFLLWQRAVLREGARLHEQHRFDLVHHVSWNTVSAPPLLWRLPVPLVWGSVGGGETVPLAFRRYLGRAWRREALRNLRVRLLPALPPLRRAARGSALVFATNRETARLLEAARAREVPLLLKNGLAPDYVPAVPPSRVPRPELTLLWAGRLEPRKALPLALEALARADQVPARLVVAGSGPLRAEAEALAARLGLERRVEFLGSVAWSAMPDLFRRADAFLFTSLRDASGSVVLEAMAHALPVLTLDHQGVGFYVPGDAGIKVPVTTPEETVRALADGLRLLARSPETRARLGDAAWAYARTQTWDRRVQAMTGWYEECLRR